MAYDEQLDKITQRELNPIVNEKINLSYDHISDTVPHVSEIDRERWDAAADRGVASGSEDGLMSKEDKIKLDGIEEGANNYIHPKSSVNVGTYLLTTVNDTGHVIGGSNPSSLDISVTNSQKLNNQEADYYAPRRSPILLGIPQCPTPDDTSANTQIANTSWVGTRIQRYHEEEIVLGVNFTGICTGPAPSKDADNTQIPNTAWVRDIIETALANYRPVIVGMPYIWHSNELPPDAFWCDGSSFDTKKYPDLAKVYPTGKVPDYRGTFLRALDRGKGYDSNRVLGSYQVDEQKTTNHYHHFGMETVGHNNGHFLAYSSSNRSDFNIVSGTGRIGWNGSGHSSSFSSGKANGNLITSLPVNLNSSGSGENRVKNIAVNYIVFGKGFAILKEAVDPPKQYTISIVQPVNGRIMFNGVRLEDKLIVNEGDQVIIQAIADNGYTVNNLIIDNEEYSNPYTLVVSKNHSVRADISETLYNIEVSETEGATITLNGEEVNNMTVSNGQIVTLDVTAEPGYIVSEVYVNGSVVQVPYQIRIDSSSVYVSVVTTANTHTISVSQPSIGGFITLNGETTTSMIVNDGDTVIVDVTTNEGYELDFINIDNTRYESAPQEIVPDKDIFIYGQFKVKQTTPPDTGEEEEIQP